MIARQKSKGKRELLNLQSSINYGDASVSSRRSKGKARMLYGCVLWWVVGYLSGFWVFFRVWLGSFVGCFGRSFLGSFYILCQLLQVSFWCFLCILHVYQGAPLRFFNKSFLTYQKKSMEDGAFLPSLVPVKGNE